MLYSNASPIEQQLCFESFETPAISECRRATNGNKAQVSGLLGQTHLVKPFKFSSTPYEYKVIALRECPTPEEMQLCDTPKRAADYFRRHIATHPLFDPERECFSVFLLNGRNRIKGHQFVSTGTMDTVLVHPREVFRLALCASAARIILTHNHPSGESAPSQADIQVTRDLVRAGQLMRIEVYDHVVVGNKNHSSLRDMGYFEM